MDCFVFVGIGETAPDSGLIFWLKGGGEVFWPVQEAMLMAGCG